MRLPRSILITGASSGIGAALAYIYSGPGVRLALGGRDFARLSRIATRCNERGAIARHYCVDVTDAAAMTSWIRTIDDAAPLDLVIANAGIANGMAERAEAFDVTRRIIEINLLGTLNTMEPALERMRQRGEGQIALMSSIAALRGVPGAHAYCASKAALKALSEGLRAPLAAEGIAVNLILPGFVRTPMNEGRGFPTPMRIEPERAARIIQKGLIRNRTVIAFPAALVWATRLLAIWPSLADALAQRYSRRAS